MRLPATLALVLSLICSACAETHIMTATTAPPRIQKLFEKTKPVCFGRFIIDVPAETTVIPGSQAFGPDIETIENGADSVQKMAYAKKKELEVIRHETEPGSLLRQFDAGPTSGSWTLFYREDESATRVMRIMAYMRATPHAFLYKGATGDERTEETETAKLQYIATHLRARTPDEIPAEPGVCLNLGFIADDLGKYQEIFGIGFRFPSLPDVSLSISSNKDGQTPEPLSKRRQQAAKLALGSPFAAAFSKIKVLREGPHKLYQWEGEEALFRRPREEGGVWQEFRYGYPGIRYDRNNPRFDATLFTGVDRNTAGALESSLSDDEAIALWDVVMSTLRLRVPVR